MKGGPGGLGREGGNYIAWSENASPRRWQLEMRPKWQEAVSHVKI